MGDVVDNSMEGPEAMAQPDEPRRKVRRAPRITRINVVAITLSTFLVIVAMLLTTRLIAVSRHSDETYARFKACADADTQLMEASDYLTTQVRLFVTTGDRTFMDNYFTELLETRRRDEAVAILESLADSDEAKADLAEALDESNELALVEEYAMRLMVEAELIDDLPEPVEATRLDAGDDALSRGQKERLAYELVIGDSYDKKKAAISQDVERSASGLVSALDSELLAIERETGNLLAGLVGVGVLLLATVVVSGIATHQLVTRPMRIHEENLAQKGHLDRIGCYEMRRVVDAYNELLDRTQEEAEHFKHEAEIDALTSLLNRGSYDRILAGREGDYALVLADVDHFKEVNDRFGHELGDEVIRAVAHVIEGQFRSTDFVCRLGGDEFAVILPGMRSENRATIEAKLAAITDGLGEIGGDMLNVTLSFGVAFSDSGTEDIYNDADKALYDSKHGGRNRVTFYEG